MAPLVRSRQSPSDMMRRNSPLRNPPLSERNVEYITDSDEEEENAGAAGPHGTEVESAQMFQQDDADMEDAEDARFEVSTTLPPATVAARPARPLAVVPEEVTCVCSNRAIKGRLRVGECSLCSRLLHLSCRARNASNQKGWSCYECIEGVLDVFQYDPKELTYIDEADLKGTKEAVAIEAADPSPRAPPTGTESLGPEDIECICPNRVAKVRTRLARCLDCGQVMHIPCRARNVPRTSGYACFKCEGVLESAPDYVRGKASSKRLVLHTHSVEAKPKPSSIITKSKHTSQMRNVAAASESPKRLRVISHNLGATSNAVSHETPSRRHNLRQRVVPNMKDRPTRTRRQLQPKDKVVTKQYNDVRQLLQKSNLLRVKVKAEPRTTDLHQIFLSSVPVNVLWRHYCTIPADDAANVQVRKTTEMEFVTYRQEPVNAAPEAWTKELKYRLGLLLDAAVSDGQTMHLPRKKWERDAGLALRHLRDLAMEVLHHGSYKGKRAKLGVLAEVLGLSQKGAFWKGGDRFGGNEARM